MGKRVGLVDELRGIAYIAMIIYHIYFDIAFVYMIDLPDIVDIVMRWLQPLIAGTFITIAGISSNYSQNNFRRGAVYFFAAMLMTFVTSAFMPGEIILFGVLHFMGIAAMIYGFVGKFTEAIPWLIGVILFALLFAVTLGIPQGYFGIPGLFAVPMPHALYEPGYLFPLGFPSKTFFSSDYFPLIPNLFLFFAGASIGSWLKSGRAPKGIYMERFKGLTAIGKHGLIIYLLHQPAALLILELIFKITGGNTIFL